MTKISFHKDQTLATLDPNRIEFEVVERKFRGHPDSLADMVAQSFMQKYIHHSWDIFPELSHTYFPNFSADKVTLSGASTEYKDGKYGVIKPVDALLIGKMTEQIGDERIDIDTLFKDAIEDIFSKCLGHDDYRPHIRRKTYSVSLAVVDHNRGFYQPNSVNDLLDILKAETHVNDTVYVVAFTPYSATEKLAIYLDNITASEDFKQKFPEIGSDIKAMIRRRLTDFDITLCLPVLPEKVQDIALYESIIQNVKLYLHNIAGIFLKNTQGFEKATVELKVNTKDTHNKKYFAVWGTALSKGDIGAVGRGNRQQGFISGLRPSTNEAISGKNPNHFAGIICYLIAENISHTIYSRLGLKNTVYIVANNGDSLTEPNSIDIILEDINSTNEQLIKELVEESFTSIEKLRTAFINRDPFERFMSQTEHVI